MALVHRKRYSNSLFKTIRVQTWCSCTMVRQTLKLFCSSFVDVCKDVPNLLRKRIPTRFIQLLADEKSCHYTDRITICLSHVFLCIARV